MGERLLKRDYKPIARNVNTKLFNVPILRSNTAYAFDIRKRLIYTIPLAPKVSLAGAKGLVAQLVEQRTENPRVGGSNPSQATIYIEEKDALKASFLVLCSIFQTAFFFVMRLIRQRKLLVTPSIAPSILLRLIQPNQLTVRK